jgi:hypothetical protein
VAFADAQNKPLGLEVSLNGFSAANDSLNK